jgi:hypothetical protein
LPTALFSRIQPDLLKETVLHLHFWFLDIRLEQFLQQGKALHHIHLQFRSQKALNVQIWIVLARRLKKIPVDFVLPEIM